MRHLRAAVAAIAVVAIGAGAGAAGAAAPAGPWDAFNLAPAGRTVGPVSVFTTGGTVTNSGGVLSGQPTTLTGAGSYVTLDFGKEVGGFVKLRFGAGTSPAQTVGLTFSESSVYVDPTRNDASNGGSNNEPPLEYPVTPGATVDTRTDLASAGRPAPTALANATAAGDTSIPVQSTTGFFPGTQVAVDSGAAREVVTVTDLQGGVATTLFAAAAAGDTNVKVASVTGLVVGARLNVDAGALLETRTITAVGTQGRATTLSAAAVVGATNIKVGSVTGLVAGGAISVDTGANLETATIQTVGTAGSGGTGLTLQAPLTRAHANGSAVRYGGTGITLDAPLTGAHAQGVAAAVPQRMGITPALAVPHAGGTSVVLGPSSSQRGGFRFLTVVNRTGGSLDLTGVSLDITFTPQMSDMRAYANYFYSNDPLINRIWYGGAYTVQTNIIANDEGRVWGAPALGWNNGARIGELGTTVLVDGAKRDRTVWPGDLGISVPTDYVSLGDMVTIKNSLQTLFNHQAASGALPYAGPAVNFIGNSDAYHMWSLIGTANYYQYTADKAWVDTVWPQYKLALTYITNKIATDNLLNVTSASDWARTDANGKNIEANAIMYHTLMTCQTLAGLEGEPDLAASCASRAAALKTAVNSVGFWDPARGLYRNKTTGSGASLYPQDGNSLAIWYGLVDSPAKATAISAALKTRWTPVGAQTPEKNAQAVHPFPGSMEVNAHLAAGEDTRALDLMRLEWGYMLNAPQGTASTYWEGYRTDGTSDYSGSYQSLAHGWSAGPTASLTLYVLGIHPDPAGGLTYSLIPHPGDLRHVEGQLDTPRGLITQSYDVDPSAGTFSARYSAPAGVLDAVAAPSFSRSVALLLDGRLVWDGTRAVGAGNARTDGTHVYVDALPGAHSLATCPVTSCAIGDVGGTVAATLSLMLSAPASFGAFTPGVARDYAASTTATVTSTAGDATLSVADPSANATGHLVNGSYSLPQSLQAKASSAAGTGGAFAPLSSTAGSPLALLSYAGPVSNDPVSLEFRQSIGATDPLRTGSYSKTLTFTLSTTTP